MSRKPKCPECGSATLVKETRAGDGRPIYYHRVRKCVSKLCGKSFTTVEVYAPEQSIPNDLRKPRS